MSDAEYIEESERIREICEEMADEQLADLIELLEYDLANRNSAMR